MEDENTLAQSDITRDDFLGGRLSLQQPAKGFRAGIDSVLLGASVSKSANKILEFGAGVGVAASVALHFNSQARATLVELQPQLVALLHQNMNANGFADRSTIIQADILQSPTELVAAGLDENSFDAVFFNPPFFGEHSSSVSANAVRAQANHMQEGSLEIWIKRASTFLRNGGELTIIHRAEALGELLAALDKRFAQIVICPIHPRQGEPAKRLLVRGIKGSRAPLKILSGLMVHQKNSDAYCAEIEQTLRGENDLNWKFAK